MCNKCFCKKKHGLKVILQHPFEMAEENMSENEFLPDLPDETVGEQLILMQKVYRCNELFIKRHEEIIDWLLFPPDRRNYPKHAMKNKYGYRKRALKYKYDSTESKLYQNISFLDGIGKKIFL